MTGRCPAAITAFVLILAGGEAWAAPPSTADVEAISHTLGFIQGIPRTGNIRIAVVYDPAGADAAADAAKAVAALSAVSGPGTTALAPVAVAADGLATAGDLNALMLMPGTGAVAPAIVVEAKRRRIVTVSVDPQCLAQQSCVLWVQAEPHVAVTLDTKLADALSVKISPIFAMMVKRK